MSNQLVSFNDVDDSADTLELIKLGRELEIEKGSLNQRIRELEDQLNARTRWEIIADTVNRFRIVPRLAITQVIGVSDTSYPRSITNQKSLVVCLVEFIVVNKLL